MNTQKMQEVLEEAKAEKEACLAQARLWVPIIDGLEFIIAQMKVPVAPLPRKRGRPRKVPLGMPLTVRAEVQAAIDAAKQPTSGGKLIKKATKKSHHKKPSGSPKTPGYFLMDGSICMTTIQAVTEALQYLKKTSKPGATFATKEIVETIKKLHPKAFRGVDSRTLGRRISAALHNRVRLPFERMQTIREGRKVCFYRLRSGK